METSMLILPRHCFMAEPRMAVFTANCVGVMLTLYLLTSFLASLMLM